MKNYYESALRNRHTVNTSDNMDKFIYQRMEKLKIAKFKKYFMYLLGKDGYKPVIEDL